MADTEISDLTNSPAQTGDELVTVRTADVAGGNRKCTAQSIADLYSVTQADVTQHEAAIDHDALTNFVAGEHFLQSAISITASQVSDFDAEVSNNSSVTANTAKVSYDAAAQAEMAANNAKVTNATHTGDVTGSTALTIANGAVDIANLSATGTADASTFLRGDNTWATPGRDKSITVEDPTGTEDISIWFTNKAITITEIRAVLLGSSTPSVTWTIRHGTDRSATGAEVVTSGTTTTSTTTGSDVTTFNDATVVADSFIWLETTAQSGTVDQLHITIVYTED